MDKVSQNSQADRVPQGLGLEGLNDLNAFVRSNSGWMLAVALRILQDRAHAEDAVQMAFSKVFNKVDGFDGRSALKTWMHRIVVNEALMILRKIKRRQEQTIDGLMPEFDSSGCRIAPDMTDTATPEILLQKAQTNISVREAIGALPDAYRIILCLRDIEGFSTLEVSQLLSISEANVKTRLHRARAALKKILEPLLKEQKI